MAHWFFTQLMTESLGIFFTSQFWWFKLSKYNAVNHYRGRKLRAKNVRATYTYSRDPCFLECDVIDDVTQAAAAEGRLPWVTVCQ
jgi:hypothetical protein